MSELSKRVMVFGPYHAACLYARSHNLKMGQWLLGATRERVLGLDPRAFETVIVGGELDEEATAALKEWEFRRSIHS